MKQEILMENGSYIEIEELYRDEEFYVERFDIKAADDSVITSTFVTKNLDGSVIRYDFRKPEWLIRDQILSGILPSRLS